LRNFAAELDSKWSDLLRETAYDALDGGDKLLVLDLLQKRDEQFQDVGQIGPREVLYLFLCEQRIERDCALDLYRELGVLDAA